MNSKTNEVTEETKKERVEALLEELYSVEHRTFLEIQFEPVMGVYQAYPTDINVTGLSDTQFEELQRIIDEHCLKPIEQDSNFVTARFNSEPTVTEHMEVIEAILSRVNALSFQDVELAFLAKREPESPEPLLWTDVE
ncbi:hypothetical protein HZS55_22030 [Halosimplex rubrum]|uniref:Uncharacterized protein n=1 Tax=Halosimplex rubrum TaxID=869889 RepID=A0A7D5SSP0_9EURY|nr:hypothetical protein [Halosimplex rubrum]QLH79807.1 hypothetical protein HZS55_22030 [Halosimplex rubrum]